MDGGQRPLAHSLMVWGGLLFVVAVGGRHAFDGERVADTRVAAVPPTAVRATAVAPLPTGATLHVAATPPATTTTTRAPVCDPSRFAEPPANGTDLDPPDRAGGLGWLLIRNGLSYDATVKLVTADEPPAVVRHVVVRAGDEVRLEAIGEGTYKVLFSRGRGWDEGRGVFACDRQAREFSDTLTFAEVTDGRSTRYSTWTVTLNGVPGGTAKTEGVDLRTFDQLGA